MVKSHSRSNLKQAIAAVAIALICGAGVAALQIPQLNQLRASKGVQSPEQAQQDVNLEQLRLDLLHKLPSFGFANLIADWTLINFFIYFGDDPARDQTGYSLSDDYFEVIIGRDPRFVPAYFFMSSSVSLYGGMPEKTVALIEQGLQSIRPTVPRQSYYIWRYKGIDELLFLGDQQAARQSFETAANWARLYNDPESQNVAAISQRTATFLADNPVSKRAQIDGWALIFNTTSNQRTRDTATQRIRDLGGDIRLNAEGSVDIKYPQND